MAACAQGAVTQASLIKEMTDLSALTHRASPPYVALQSTSFNRESTKRGEPGWFADSDGTGFIRTEERGGHTEWVLMEHEGPGAITRIWTPFFYYDFNERTGPHVRVYLDGAERPVIDESLIKLVTGKGSVPAPFAGYTARAGDCYLPIPFAKSCKVTMAAKPFYYSISYRAYPASTHVETFQSPSFSMLQPPASPSMPEIKAHIAPGACATVELPAGPHAVTQFNLILAAALSRPVELRSTVLEMTFDGERTVWCPVGDFWSCPDSLHEYKTLAREVTDDGTLSCRWQMPYERSATIRLVNLAELPVDVGWRVKMERRTWDERSLHFHASWRPDDIVAGTPFQDWNFVDIHGDGIYVGDAWTVLNPQQDTWWGEGDEKVYVDGAWEAGFPTHFGTGSEDYYGWAGGVLPTRADEFSSPFQANVRVGGFDGHTLGYNICTRERGLDAVPFTKRLRFDMESSFGVDIRNPWNLLGYSAVTFYYACPGATDNRPPDPKAAAKPIMSLDQLRAESKRLKR